MNPYCSYGDAHNIINGKNNVASRFNVFKLNCRLTDGENVYASASRRVV